MPRNSQDFQNHCCSPSDYVVRNWDWEEEYAQFKNELHEVYQEQPTWLRIREEDAHTMTPIAYVDSECQTGRGFVIIHETSPELVTFDVDEGIYQEVNIKNVFYLGKYHSQILAFSIPCVVQGVKPPSLNMWVRIQSREDYFRYKLHQTHFATRE